MLYELDQPAFVEIVEKASDVSVQNEVHLLLQERVRQRIQRIVLAAPRAKSIRETEKILFVNLIEDNDRNDVEKKLAEPRSALQQLGEEFAQAE